MRFAVVMLVAGLAGGQDVTIRTRTNLVVAPTTVTDLRGQVVDGLAESDFVVLDNGKERRIRMDTSDIALTPISLVVAVQAGAMSSAALAKIRKVGSVIQPLITGDKGEAAVIRFSNEVQVVEDFTPDVERISKAFRSLKSRGDGGRSLDAVAQSIEMLKQRPADRRKIVILISESRDRGSGTKLPDLLKAAQLENVTVYPVTFSVHATPWTAKPEDAPPAAGGFDILGAVRELTRLGTTNTAEELARFTGGRRLSFVTLRGLESDLSRVGEELHSQYLLSFTPEHAEGDESFHVLEVKVKGRSDLKITTRPGYWPM